MAGKFKKCALFTVAFLSAAIVLIFLPPVQKIIIKSKLKRYCTKVSLSSCHIGLKTIEAKNLSFCYNGTEVDVKHASIQWAMSDFILLHKLFIDDLTIDGLVVNLKDENIKKDVLLDIKTSIDQNIQAQDRTVKIHEENDNSIHSIVPMLLTTKTLHVPMSAAINNFKINGEILQQNKIHGIFNVEGKDIRPFMYGKINFSANVDFTREKSGNFNIVGIINSKQNEKSEIVELSLDSQCVSTEKSGAYIKTMLITADFNESNKDKMWLKAKIFDKTASTDLMTLDCKYSAETDNFLCNFHTAFDCKIINCFMLGNQLKPANFESNCTIEYDTANKICLTNCNFSTKMSNEMVAQLGVDIDSDITTTLSASAKTQDSKTTVQEMTLSVISDSNSINLQTYLPQPLTTKNSDMFSAKILSGYEPGIAIELNNLDVSLLNQIIYPTKIKAQLASKTFLKYNNGNFILQNTDDNHTVLTNVIISLTNQPFFNAEQISCDIKATAGDVISFAASNLSINDINGRNLSQGDIDAKIQNKKLTARIYFVTDIPAMLVQGVFSPNMMPRAGILSTKLDLEQSQEKILATLDTKIKGLFLKPKSNATDASAIITCKVKNNNFDIKCPITISGIGISDMDINANGNFGDSKKLINVTFDGNVVYPQDIYNLLSITSINSQVLQNTNITSNLTPIASALPKETIDMSRPLWANYDVGITGHIQQLAFSEKYAFSDLDLKADVNNTCISIDNFSADCAGAPFAGKAKITFSPNTIEPYKIDGAFSLKSFNIGGLYNAVNDYKEVVSGTISSNCSVFSSGASFSDAIENLQLKMQIDGYNGKIMALKSVNNTTKSALIIANVAASIFSKKDQNRTNVINSVMDALSCIEYDTLSCEITRGESKDIYLKFLSIKGPEVMFTSTGKILFSNAKSVMDQELILQSKLYASGKMATMLNDIGLLDEKTNAENYNAGPEFIIRGTLREPNLDELKDILKAAGSHVLQSTFF